MPYTCGMCGKVYTNIADYVTCVNKCAEHQKRLDEQAEAKKREHEKETRKAEVIAKCKTSLVSWKEFERLLDKYQKDYKEILEIDVGFDWC